MSASKDNYGGGGNARGTWRDVKRGSRCPICDHDSWCQIRYDGAFVLCRRNSVGSISTRIGSDGKEIYVHVLDANASGRDDGEMPEGPDASKEVERAGVDALDKVYRLELAELRLSDEHRENLRERGLSDDEIKARGYRSLPLEGRAAIATRLVERVGDAVARSIPGLFVKEKDGKTWWSLGGTPGLLVPMHNLAGQIFAIKVRRDGPKEPKESRDGPRKAPRYTYVSSVAHGGPKALNGAHVPLASDEVDRSIVRVVEGELKADITTTLSSILTLSIPGVGSGNFVLPVLREIGTKVVLVAFDADHLTKPEVALALVSFCRSLTEFAWSIELWDPAHGNGIDDVLAAGHGETVRLCSGEAATKYLAELEEKHRPKPDSKALSDALRARVKAEKEKQAAVAKAKQRSYAEATAKEFHAENSSNTQAQIVQKKTSFEVGDHHELAVHMLRFVQGKSPEKIVYDLGAFWRYKSDRGIYEQVEETEMYIALGMYHGCATGPKEEPLEINHGTSSGTIKLAARYRAKPDFFADAPVGIAFKNGFVTVSGGKIQLHEHGPKHRAMHALDFDYDVNADVSAWLAFFESVFTMPEEIAALAHGSLISRDSNEYKQFQADSLDRPKKIMLAQEFLGACLIGEATKYQMALVLIGEGNNGKSVLLTGATALFPESSVIGIAPHDWKNIFFKAEISGKRLNAVAEMPENELVDTPAIKAIISGDKILVHRKNERPFMMKPIAGHLLAANLLPTTKDQTRGFWRRFLVLVFKRDFTNDPARVIALEEFLCRPENLQGFAVWCLAGAARLQEQKQYTIPQSMVDAIEEWRGDSDQVRQWRDQCTRTIEADKKNGETPKPVEQYLTSSSRAYESYRLWAKRTGHNQPLTSRKFWQRLGAIHPVKRLNTNNAYTFRLLIDDPASFPPFDSSYRGEHSQDTN